mgnify:FL=1
MAFKVGDRVEVKEADPNSPCTFPRKSIWVAGYEVVQVGLYGQVEPFRGPSDLVKLKPLRDGWDGYTKEYTEYNVRLERRT